MLDNLRDARQSLEQAEDVAQEQDNTGTLLMVHDLIQQVTELIQRTEGIHDDE